MFKSRLKSLFLEASMLMGISENSLIQGADSLFNYITDAFIEDNINSVKGHYQANYGKKFGIYIDGFIKSINKKAEDRSFDYDVSKTEAAKAILKMIKNKLDDYITMMTADPSYVQTFEESSLSDMVEGFMDAMEEDELYRAAFFLVSYMIKEKTASDIMGKGFRD